MRPAGPTIRSYRKSFHSNSNQIIIHIHGIVTTQEDMRTSYSNVQKGDAVCVSGM